ncbi:OmpA family protein [Rubellimicrobium arenae]|uniref:OmpA family protein n=1 Tax=Rubellimicrobium arenae TaxID=2817372 RepID=UPI001B314623|nr:OmpA family protein [Rubellimicrobium arenae]
MRPSITGLIPTLLFVIAACTRMAPEEAGSGPAWLGGATAQNVLAQSGQLSYAVSLSNRFAATVPTTINFAFNSADLDAQARSVLTQQASFIRQFPEVRFAVYGHTDLVGSAAYNQQLGLKRAQAAVAFLISQGVEPSRLMALVSRGETQPLIATQAPEMANRRTVTDVSGFVETHPDVLNGKYAAIVFRDYVASAGTEGAPPAPLSETSP